MSLKNLLLVLLLSMSILGCTAHRSSISEGVSKNAIYEIDETQIFNIVHSSIQEVFPMEKISVITVPTRGYITKFLAPPLHLDWFTQKVLVHRSSGINVDGDEVFGYWIEVSGSGSSFLQGQLKNEEVFSTILSHLESVATKHTVRKINVEPYLVNQESFYVRGADTLEGNGTRVVISNEITHKGATSMSEKLRELHQLKADGVITAEEFEQTKQKILEKY